MKSHIRYINIPPVFRNARNKLKANETCLCGLKQSTVFQKHDRTVYIRHFCSECGYDITLKYDYVKAFKALKNLY